MRVWRTVRAWAALDPEFTRFAAFIVLAVLLFLLANPQAALSKPVQGGVGWGFLASLAASALCFTMVPTLSDLPAAALKARRAGGQYAAAALLLAFALFLLFVSGITTAQLNAGVVVWVKRTLDVVSWVFFALPALGAEMMALGVVVYGSLNLAGAVRMLLFPKPTDGLALDLTWEEIDEEKPK